MSGTRRTAGEACVAGERDGADEAGRTLRERVAEVVSDIPAGCVTTYGTIAALVGSGPRQVGRVMAAGSPDGAGDDRDDADTWPWWHVTNVRGELPEHLRARARRAYDAEGTAMRGERVDLRRARWSPPL